MTYRVQDGKVYNQIYNIENRLITVQLLSQGDCPAENTEATSDIAASWNFFYDGDGNRVRQEYFEGVFGQDIAVKVTSYFMGGSYEVDQNGVVQADLTILVSEPTIQKYYTFAGAPVAMTECTDEECSPLVYFITDQLGSVIEVLDASGELVSQQRYLPFGGVRTDVGGVTQTDFGYTGQRNMDAQGNGYSLGLMDYHARFYDPYLNRWTQPDTVTVGGPQGLDRYGYVLNDPINYADPTGHRLCDEVLGDHCASDGGSGGTSKPSAPAGTPPNPCEIDPGLPMCMSEQNPSASEPEAKPATPFDILEVAKYVAGETNQRVSSPIPLNIYTSKDYELLGGISITHTPFVNYNNNELITLGTNNIIATSSTLGPLSLRTSVDPEIVPSYGIFTSSVDYALKQTIGVSAPILLDPREVSVSVTYSVGSNNSQISFGDTFNFNARINPLGYYGSLIVLGVVYAPEITIPAVYTLCQSSGTCP